MLYSDCPSIKNISHDIVSCFCQWEKTALLNSKLTWLRFTSFWKYGGSSFYSSISTAANIAFQMALCELSLWHLRSMKISKFVQYYGYLSSVSLRLQMDYQNIWILWFTRQLELELMFFSIISLRTADWSKGTKLFTDLLTLFISFIYPLGLFIRFGRFFLPYLRALVLMYTVFIPIAISVSFCHISERSTFTLSSIYISNVRMKNIFRFPLRHHLCLIKPTTLQ